MNILNEKNERIIREEKNRMKIQKSIAYAKATLAIEGRNLTPEAEELISRNLHGEISQEEFLEAALQITKSGARS